MKQFILQALLITTITASAQDKITIEAKPGTIYIEQGSHKQIVNFDFLVTNRSADTLSLDKLSVSVYDRDHNLLQSRFLDNNGTAPSILMLPKRMWNGKTAQLIFNPFSEFELATSIHSLEYEWQFSDNRRNATTAKTIVYPKAYAQTKLNFPLKGAILVYDAHDYASHHRRFDYTFAPIEQLGLVTNFMRYAYDFMVVSAGKQFKTTGATDADYYSYGSPIYAVAKGKVIYVASHHKDDKKFDIPKLKENPLELYGNCIAIQHADHSVSIYGHLKENSITVKMGDTVSEDTAIAQIGVSGSSFLPHLHFEIRTSLSHTAEGLPSYFKNIYLLEGKSKRKLETGLVETGQLLEAK